MKFLNLLNRLTGQPWFITEEALSRITHLAETRLALPGAPVALPAEIDDGEDGDDLPGQVPGVAQIAINGVLGNHLSLMERACGGVDYGALVSQARTAAIDPGVNLIFLHFQVCPGGMVNGCPEAFAALREIRAESGKPMIALVTGMACSAAQYLAAACDLTLCTETAMLGSIGVMRTIEDRTEANAKAGVKRFTIASAPMKDIGNPDRPITDPEMKVLTDMSAAFAGMFQRDMRAVRPQIAPEVYATGLPYVGTDAVRLGLADGMVSGIEATLGSIASAMVSGAPAFGARGFLAYNENHDEGGRFAESDSSGGGKNGDKKPRENEKKN